MRRILLASVVFLMVFGLALGGLTPAQAQTSYWTVSVSCPTLSFSYDLREYDRAQISEEYEGFYYVVSGPGGYYASAEWPNPNVTVSLPVGASGTYVIQLWYQYVFEEIPAFAGPQEVGAEMFDETSVVVDCPTAVGFNCPVKYPILSSALVSIVQPGRWAPGKDEVVLPDGTKVILPIDVDKSGVDEYLVIDKATYNGELWVGLFIGGCAPVWVPASQVTLLRPLS